MYKHELARREHYGGLVMQATNQETTETFLKDAVRFSGYCRRPASQTRQFENGDCYENLSTFSCKRQVGFRVFAMSTILHILSLALWAQQMVENQTR